MTPFDQGFGGGGGAGGGQGPPGPGVPNGGATDEILGKTSAANLATSWRPSGVPRGGIAPMILAKVDGQDFNTQWVGPPIGLPAGGNQGDVLAKRSGVDRDAIWVPTAAHPTFYGSVPAIIAGTEANGTIIATLTIPPANLPVQPFYWVCQQNGMGHFFAHNVGSTGQPSGTYQCQVPDGLGAYVYVASLTLTQIAAAPPGQLILVRGTLQTTGYRIFHYDPAVDTGGIETLFVVASAPPTGGTCTFVLEGYILQFG
jgi:hypothetical protein